MSTPSRFRITLLQTSWLPFLWRKEGFDPAGSAWRSKAYWAEWQRSVCPFGHAVYQSSEGRKFDLWGMNDWWCRYMFVHALRQHLYSILKLGKEQTARYTLQQHLVQYPQDQPNTNSKANHTLAFDTVYVSSIKNKQYNLPYVSVIQYFQDQSRTNSRSSFTDSKVHVQQTLRRSNSRRWTASSCLSNTLLTFILIFI